MRTYDTYKDSGISWLGKIPSHWELKPGFSLYHVNNEKFDMLSEPTVLSLSYGNIIVKKNKDEGLVPENYSGYQVIKPDYIIIRCTDLQNDKVSLRTGIAKNHGIITGAYLGLIANYGFNAQYLHYFLHDWDITKEIYRHGSGLRQVLSWNDMKRLPILVPPLAEQEAIVAYLDRATAEIDKAIASQQRMVELLQERKQIIINQAVTQGLNPDAPMKPTNIDWLPQIPAHWNVTRIKNIASVKTGKTPPSDSKEYYENGDILWYTPGDFYSDSIYLNDSERKITDKSIKEGIVKLFPKNSVLLVSIGGSIGKVGLSKCICFSNQQINAIIPNDLNDSAFLAYYLQSKSSYIYSEANTATLPIINQQMTKQLMIALPPLAEQVSIVIFIELSIEPINKAISRCERKMELLTERKQILINDVVTGKIKVV